MGYIHGGADEREAARLEKQARFAAPFILERFDAAPGMRVLDLATGVGAMAGQLLQRYPGIELFGADLDAGQLRFARTHHPQVRYVRADAARLPFESGTFDRVHASWLLEHVREPVAILQEVKRILKPGGYCHFIEVDNATFRTVPELPEVNALMDTLNRRQLAAGGDPFIGPKLERYFQAAGFARIELLPARLFGSSAAPADFEAMVVEFAEIFESLDEALGTHSETRVRAAVEAIRSLPRTPGGEFHYCSTIARGWA